MRKLFVSICLAALSVSIGAVTPNSRKMSKIVNEGLKFSEQQALLMYESVKDIPGRLPDTVKDGELLTVTSKGWTSGFIPGVLWYAYENSGNPEVRKAAEDLTERIADQQYNKNSHDVGFVVNCSYGNGYRLTGNEEYRKVLVNAGKSLGTRFNETVGCTRSWRPRPARGWDFIVIIDNMMNLELLTVGSALSGDPTDFNHAVTHATTTMKNHFRPDGSSFHVVNYDEKTGKILTRQTYQGLADDSSWSRGQGWGLYGYTMMYRQTGRKEFLEHAIKIGKYIMNHPNLPKDKVAYWDMCAPAKKDTPRDASAAGLMASAYVELSTYVEDKALAASFLKLAEDIIVSLSSPKYRAKLGENHNFIIKHATIFFPKGNFDTPVSYADYYYVEALSRYKRLLEGKPVVDVRTVTSTNPDRQLWITTMDRVCRPVLENLAAGTLRANMPIESNSDLKKRAECTHLEAFGRVMVGIAPWLALGEDSTPEGRLRGEFIDLVVKATRNAVDPASPDHLNFNQGRQPLVDAAFLAHGFLRAPALFEKLDAATKANLRKEWESSRCIKPSETNWLFFSAIVETALLEFYGPEVWDPEKVKYAFSRFCDGWYKGDGFYGDGPAFHLDFYNSFVIQPMMMQVLDVMEKHKIEGAELIDVEKARYARYAELQERMISPEGTYPIVGRSLAYRFGAFQALSDVALRHMLPESLDPAQVRCALTAVISRQINAPDTFDSNGWLTVGFCGHQPSIGERYISTGSVYLCSEGLVALGLPADDPFWTRPAAPWTCLKGWTGVDIPADHAIKN